jgi:uncharacterized membrane protein YhaH (DUF805 family)
MGRGQFALITLVISLASYAALAVIALSSAQLHDTSTWGVVVFVVTCLLQAIFAVRRLHDIGKPGWYLWLFLIPFYNIYLSLVLCFTRGSSQPNDHGPPAAAV